MRAVVFDYGQTLVTFTFPRACLLRFLEDVRPILGPGAPDAQALLGEVLEPIEDLLPSYGEDEVEYLDFYERAWARVGLAVPRETLYGLLDAEQRCWDAAVTVVADALRTLDVLRADGLRTAVASNAPFPPEMMRRQLAVNGVAQRMDAIVFSSEVGRRKPAPELYLAALERLQVPPGDALYVGDRVLEDYEGPRRVGMRAVLCTATAGAPPDDGVPSVSRLAELPAYVKALR